MSILFLANSKLLFSFKIMLCFFSICFFSHLYRCFIIFPLRLCSIELLFIFFYGSKHFWGLFFPLNNVFFHRVFFICLCMLCSHPSLSPPLSIMFAYFSLLFFAFSPSLLMFHVGHPFSMFECKVVEFFLAASTL